MRGYSVVIKSFYLLISLVLLLALYSSGNCEKSYDLVEQVDHGIINWTNGIIRAKGTNAPDKKDFNVPLNREKALSAATEAARNNLLDTAKEIQINNQFNIENLTAEKTGIKKEIEDMVKNARTVEQKYLTNGTVEVIVQMDLRGGFSQLVLPEDIKQIDSIKVLKASDKNKQPDTSESFHASPGTKTEYFTGLIVDATGIQARPSMVPVVLDETGRKVYGPAFISRESAVQYGACEYGKDVQASKENSRIGTNPLIVKGLRTEGSTGTHIIISNADALILRSRPEHLTFLKKCRVIMVLDEFKADNTTGS